MRLLKHASTLVYVDGCWFFRGQGNVVDNCEGVPLQHSDAGAKRVARLLVSVSYCGSL